MKKIVIIFLCMVMSLGAKDGVDIRTSLASIVNNAFASQERDNKVIAIAAKNKMLSQKMAKLSILIANGQNPQQNYQKLQEAIKEFEILFNGLERGDTKHKIAKNSDPDVKRILKETKAAWHPFKKALSAFYKDGKVNKDAYAYILQHNEKILRLSHKLTQTLKSKRKIKTTLNKVVEHSLKIADRQRVLTQKMYKEKMLLFYGVETKANKPRLNGSLILFENGLKGLMRGENRRGLVKITNKKIKQELQQLWHMWQTVAPIYRKEKISKEELALLGEYEPKLLKRSNTIVTLIEKSLEI